jgi:glycosyltransferase involved in cell wall biosynthesis
MIKDSKINVLQICGGGVRSGIETYVLNLARSFRDTPFNIVICPLRYGLFTEELREEGFEPKEVLKRFRGDPCVFRKIASIIRKEDIKIVHTHGENGNLYGRIVGKLLGKKVVSTIHSHLREALVDMSGIPWVRTLAYRQDLFFNFLSDRIVAPSNAIAEELVQNGVTPERITLIHSGVEVKAFADWAADFKRKERMRLRHQLEVSDDDFLVGTVGRVAPVKNHALLIKAARIANQRNKKLKFMIIGHGPLFEEVKEMIASNGLNPFFLLPGWQRDVKPYLGILDAFAMTSLTEGLNITVIKAMAMRIPVISTNGGSLPELVKNGVTGLVVPLGAPDLLSARIIDLYKNPSLMRRLTEMAFQYVSEHFDVSYSQVQYARLYKTLVST